MAKKGSPRGKASSDHQLGALIDQLGPINNSCRRLDGIDKVERLWDLGDALLRFDPDAKDELLWTVAERSYLTRDLLRYALIIRRSWRDRTDLRRVLPRLTQYSLFREALPFLKGDRCGISDGTYNDILARLNRGDGQQTKDFLRQLKGRKIGRKHKKGQAITKMSEVAETVRTAIKQLFDLAKRDPKQIAAERKAMGAEALLILSQWCMAVSEDNTSALSSLQPTAWPPPFGPLGNGMLMVSRASREDRAGFRKALGSMILMEAADLLNALRSDERLAEWKRRRSYDLVL